MSMQPTDNPTALLQQMHRWRMAFFGLTILIAGAVIGASWVCGVRRSVGCCLAPVGIKGPDGSLALPETGRVPAAGLGLAELRDSITVKLLETYMGNLRVKVDLADAGESRPSVE